MKKLSIVLYAVFATLTGYTYYCFFSHTSLPANYTALTTAVGFAFCLVHGASQTGWRKILILMVTCFIVAMAMESIGVSTGKIYGPYHYSDQLGPKFLGLVPYLIPLAWFMMMYPSLAIAQDLLKASAPRGLKIFVAAALGGVVMTAWDLGMDPFMVQAGHWVWDGPAKSLVYFGIPLQNYLGWWITTFLTFAIFFFVTANTRSGGGKIEIRWPAIMYATVGASTVLTAYLNGLPGPAMVGLFAMLPWVLAALMK
jgi:uncharacterized membrane protein